MKNEREIKKELELLYKLLERAWKSKNDMDIIEITSRISELEWVLNKADSCDKISRIIRESIMEDLCPSHEHTNKESFADELLNVKKELDNNPNFKRKLKELAEKRRKEHSLKPEDLKKLVRG